MCSRFTAFVRASAGVGHLGVARLLLLLVTRPWRLARRLQQLNNLAVAHVFTVLQLAKQFRMVVHLRASVLVVLFARDRHFALGRIVVRFPNVGTLRLIVVWHDAHDRVRMFFCDTAVHELLTDLLALRQTVVCRQVVTKTQEGATQRDACISLLQPVAR